MRTAIRALAYVALFAVVGMGSAAGLTYLLLSDSSWTDRPPEPTATPRPAPTPAQTASPTPTAWDAADCYTTELAPVDCQQDGALAVVAVINNPGDRPCAKHPETGLVWRTGTTALCLATPR